MIPEGIGIMPKLQKTMFSQRPTLTTTDEYIHVYPDNRLCKSVWVCGQFLMLLMEVSHANT